MPKQWHLETEMRSKLNKRMEDFLSCRLAEEHPAGGFRLPVERPALTISREAGTRGLEIGIKVVDYLSQFDETAEHGWALFDQSLLADVIEERLIPETLHTIPAPSADSEPPIGAVDEMLATHPTEWSLMQRSINAIRRLCRLGNVVVLGRGANFITRDLPNAFHVRLVSPRAHRSLKAAEGLKLSTDEADSWVGATDLARTAYVERHLGSQIDDPTAYHLTINTGRLDLEMTARLIGDSLLEWTCSRCLTETA